MAGIYNCDWFSFTADFTKYNPKDNDALNPDENKQLARLFAELDEQREKPEGDGFIDLGLFKFRVYNHGNRTFYYLLECDDLEIYLMRWRSKKEDNYPVYVHLKSQFLWSDIYSVRTLEEKFRLVIEWLEDVLNGKYIASKINRCDLCYHTDEMPEPYDKDQYVGAFTLDTERRTHRMISSIDLGSRKSEKLFYRSYNKFLEVRAKKKEWFFAIWEHHGLNIRQVWNLEFQMKREFFTEAKRKIAGRFFDTAEDVIAGQAAIWWYLTHDWVSYRIPDNERRSRWSIHPWWTKLASYHECEEKISRGRQRTLPTANAIMPGLVGFLSAYAARTGDSLDGTLFDRLRADIENYDERSGVRFEDRADVKRRLMDPEDEPDNEKENRGHGSPKGLED